MRRFPALQIRDFRLFWFGEGVSAIGTQMQFTALNWHLYSLLQGQSVIWSIFGQEIVLDAGTLGLGILGLVRVIPIMVFALIGGILADKVERRRLLIWMYVISAAVVGLLAVISYLERDTSTVIYTISAILAATTAMVNPSRQSLVPNLVPRETVTNAVSLNTLIFQIGTIGGPAVAGLLLAVTDEWVVYLVDALTFGAAIASLILMTHRSKAASSEPFSWHMAFEGLRFTYNNKLLWGAMMLDFFATFFGSAKFMLPAIAVEVLNVKELGYGILSTAQPIGALLAGIVISYIHDIRRQGAAVFGGVLVYGLATAFFGISPIFGLSYFLYALTGAGDTVSMVVRQTMRQLLTPDHLRGRATSASMIFFMGGPQLGELEAGLVAAAFGVPFAIFSGGIAVVLVTVYIAWRYPILRNYEAEYAEG